MAENNGKLVIGSTSPPILGKSAMILNSPNNKTRSCPIKYLQGLHMDTFYGDYVSLVGGSIHTHPCIPRQELCNDIWHTLPVRRIFNPFSPKKSPWYKKVAIKNLNEIRQYNDTGGRTKLLLLNGLETVATFTGRHSHNGLVKQKPISIFVNDFL